MNEIQAATSAAMALSGRTMTRNDSDYNVKTTGNEISFSIIF